MVKIAFIEGVSGVGKSTLVRAAAERLRSAGYPVRAYVEFDFANPIDFYCAAYLTLAEYAGLLGRYRPQSQALARYAHMAGEAVLVRYYDGDTPLFPKPLLGELSAREFCYHPKRLVPLRAYSDAYRAVWEGFAAGMEDALFLFDGSLLHHPLNDMLRNYGVSPERAAAHVRSLLDTLRCEWRVFYLSTEDVSGQLARAHRDRGQEPPTPEEIAFWQRRSAYDRYVLENAVGGWDEWDTGRGWDGALDGALAFLRQGHIMDKGAQAHG